jgi:death-on-curing protein
MIKTLTVDDIKAIHGQLESEFASSSDPISPKGIKSEHLLESAVARQHAGLGGLLKYDTAVSNAASLGFGLCMNHPFHNGNKRTSLVTMMCHLDRNDLTFQEEIGQSSLYDFMLRIASHQIADAKMATDRSDAEVESIARWIRKRIRRIERGERVITFRKLRSILESFQFEFEDPRNNTVDLVRYEKKSTWFGLRQTTKRVRILRMAYPAGGQVVGKGLLRQIRELCALDELHGCDSQMFYDQQRPPDYFIAKYRKTLARLARV